MSTTMASLGDLRGSKVVVDLKSQNDKYLRDLLSRVATLKKENNLFISFTDVIKENSIYRLSIICYREKDLNFIKELKLNKNLIESSTTKLKDKLSGIDNVLENYTKSMSIKDIITLYNE